MKKSACLIGLVTLATLATAPSAWAAPSATPSKSATPSATPASPTATPRSSVGSQDASPAAASATPRAASSKPSVLTPAAAAAIADLVKAHPELGAPTADAVVVGSGFKQAFTSADVYYSDATGAHYIAGPFRGLYDPTTGTGAQLGFPVRDQYLGSQGANAVDFQHGIYAATANTGVHSVYGALGDKYVQLGGTNAPVGLPLSDPYTGATGAQVNRFQRGMVIYSAPTGAHEIHDDIYRQYASLGYEASVLHLPVTDEYSGATGARVNKFENGMIVWTPGSGAHEVYGSIYARFAQMGYESGTMGVPLTGEYGGATGARVNKFANGMIVWTPQTGPHEVYGSIYQKFAEVGYESGPIGVPTSGEYSGANGTRNNTFTNGMIVWTAQGGAHAVIGPIYQEYARRGYEGGSLGVPLTDAYNVNGGIEQQFQNGTLTYVNGQFTTARQSTPLKSSLNAQGNYYYAGSCAYYAYNRRVELGAPVSSLWGNAGMWANAARADGYTVDHTPQVGAVISTYGYGAGPIGHVMVVERINADGSFQVSQMNFPTPWQVTYRTFSAADAQNLWFIH